MSALRNPKARWQDPTRDVPRLDHARVRAALARYKEDTQRRVHDALKFWTACADRRCHRARSCAGDFGFVGLACCAEIRGAERVWLSELYRVVGAGGSFQDAKCAAVDARERYRDDQDINALNRDIALILRRRLTGNS